MQNSVCYREDTNTIQYVGRTIPIEVEFEEDIYQMVNRSAAVNGNTLDQEVNDMLAYYKDYGPAY